MNLHILTIFFAMIASSVALAEPVFWCSVGMNDKGQINGAYAVARGCTQAPCNAWVRLSGIVPGPTGTNIPFQSDLYGTYADTGLLVVSGDEPKLKLSIEARIDFWNDGTFRRKSYVKVGSASYPMFCRDYESHGCPSEMSCGH